MWIDMDRYFDRRRLNSIKKVMIGCYIMFGVILLPLIVILISGIQEGEMGEIVIVTILLLILLTEFIALIILGKRARRGLRYASIFEEDHDGVITFKRIQEMTGYGMARIRKDIEWLIRAQHLTNAVVDGDKIVMLSETEFIDITCPTCGAVNQVRFGSSNKCKHCGSYLRRR